MENNEESELVTESSELILSLGSDVEVYNTCGYM
jgi:hypothetical protein